MAKRPQATDGTVEFLSHSEKKVTITLSLDLEQQERVQHEDDGEEDGRAVEVALDHRAAADRAAATADAEGAGEAGVFARVEQDQEDQHDGDDHLDKSEEREHEDGF